MDVLLGDGKPWQSFIRRISETRQERRYRDGSALYRAGETPDGVFLLEYGRVAFSNLERSSLVEPTALLGISATISGQPHHDTALAQGDCSVGFIPREQFLAFLSQDADACLYILEKLSEEMKVCYDRLRKIARPAVRTRGAGRRG